MNACPFLVARTPRAIARAAMTSFLLYLCAFILGAFIAIQAPINNQLAVAYGQNTLLAAFTSFVVGGVLLAIASFATGGVGVAVSALPQQPWWRFTGGILGALYILGSIFLVARIGLAPLLALVIAGQLLSSLTIDHFGLLGLAERKLSLVKVLGAVMVMAGVAVALFGERWLSALKP